VASACVDGVQARARPGGVVHITAALHGGRSGSLRSDSLCGLCTCGPCQCQQVMDVQVVWYTASSGPCRDVLHTKARNRRSRRCRCTAQQHAACSKGTGHMHELGVRTQHR
jgi:hypothetical protein